MCGIAGLVSFDAPADRATVGRMVCALRHRGPDALSLGGDRMAVLGHARLSIIDHAGGAQPLGTRDGRYWITYNGELFNYRELRDELAALGAHFVTASDTEVVLQAFVTWGEGCLERFNGDWAFAVWDTVSRELFLARDRAGVRPLYYASPDLQLNGEPCFEAPETFLFASEIKALLSTGQIDARLNASTLQDVFTFWTPTPPQTAFENILELPPAHWMRVSSRGITIRRYWDLPITVESAFDQQRDNEEARFEHLLHDATRLRLRADVPVGGYVSGGLDSSLVAALARQLTTRELHTFSLSFDEPEYDESAYQAQVVTALGTRHETVRCTGPDIARVFADVVYHAERPILRTAPAPMYLLAQRVRDCGLKVVLTGEGADEICGGYDIFKETKVRAFWARQPHSAIRPRLLSRLYPYLPRLQKQSDAYLHAFFQPGDVTDPFFSHRPRWNAAARLLRVFSPDLRRQWQRDELDQRLTGKVPFDFARWSPVKRAQYLEATQLLPGYILSAQGDRMTMAHGVEGRFPFLDVRLMEAAAGWPSRWKLRGLEEKSLLKRIARRHVPAEIVDRPKQPYRAPEANVFFDAGCDPSTRARIDELLSPECLVKSGLFQAAAVAQLVAKFRRGTAVSHTDHMAMVGVLSTQMLIDSFRAVAHSAARPDLTLVPLEFHRAV